MDPGQKETVSPAAAADVDLDEIVDLIRAADPSGLKHLHRIFSPGIRFLIKRRLDSPDVEKETRTILEMAVQEICVDLSLEGGAVAKLVRGLVLKRCEGESRTQVEAKASPTSPAAISVQVAERVIEHLTPLERDALRRCYVLGEAPDAILKKLALSPEQLKAIQSRARAEFSAETSRQANVA
jgi:hypothetical protein